MRIELFEVVFTHGASVRVTEVITTDVYSSSFPSVSTAAMASTIVQLAHVLGACKFPGLTAQGPRGEKLGAASNARPNAFCAPACVRFLAGGLALAGGIC